MSAAINVNAGGGNTIARPRLLDWLILLSLAFVWGSSYILMKRAQLVYPPDQVAALRMTIASLALSPIWLPLLKRKQPYLQLGIIGAFGNLIPAFLFTAALTCLNSAVVGTLNGLTPVFTVVVGILIFRLRVTVLQMVGIISGLVGSAMIITAGAKIDSWNAASNQNPLCGGLVILATICYGININYTRAQLPNFPAFALSALSLMLCAIPTGIYLITFTDFSTRLIHENASWQALGYVIILSVIGTAAASGLFYWLVQRCGAIFAASGVYLTPLVAIFWGVIDGETLYWQWHGSGLIAILISQYLINRR